MLVYRICLEKWPKSLTPSGKAERWNSEGVGMIYTVESRSLALLENLVHRNGEWREGLFMLMIIYFPLRVAVDNIDIKRLPASWFKAGNFQCRREGDAWVRNASSAVLKVPSAIVNGEYNYLMNPANKEFKSFRIRKTERFRFDKRF